MDNLPPKRPEGEKPRVGKTHGRSPSAVAAERGPETFSLKQAGRNGPEAVRIGAACNRGSDSGQGRG